jgi:hypothetical protein
MAQLGAIKGVGGAAGCGRSAETSFLVDSMAFGKRDFFFRLFQRQKHRVAELLSAVLIYII